MVDDTVGVNPNDQRDSDKEDLLPSDDDVAEEIIPMRASAKQTKIPRKQVAATTSNEMTSHHHHYQPILVCGESLSSLYFMLLEYRSCKM